MQTKEEDDSPLKYLPYDDEAQSDRKYRPEVPSFREHFAIVILKVIPAVTFWEPDPVSPYQLT